MNLTAIDLNLLVALDLLLEHRSVRAAARVAGVTPSAMSHTLGRLRALTGDDLLVRAGAGMVPTPRAEALVLPVRDALAAIRHALTPPAPFAPASSSRAFRVVCTDHVSTVLLPRVAALLRAAPHAALHERPLLPTVMDELRAGEVDVAVGIFPEAPPEMRTRRLFSDGFVTVCRPGHPRLAGAKLSLERFLEEGSDDLLLTVSRRLVAEVAGRLPLAVHPTPLPVTDYVLSAVWHPRLENAAEDLWFRGLLVEAAAQLLPAP